jgi:hypothetical protein
MALFDKFEKWSEKYHAPWMGILRIILGVILTVKGFMFIVDTSTLVRILTNSFGVTTSFIYRFSDFNRFGYTDLLFS